MIRKTRLLPRSRNVKIPTEQNVLGNGQLNLPCLGAYRPGLLQKVCETPGFDPMKDAKTIPTRACTEPEIFFKLIFQAMG